MLFACKLLFCYFFFLFTWMDTRIMVACSWVERKLRCIPAYLKRGREWKKKHIRKKNKWTNNTTIIRWKSNEKKKKKKYISVKVKLKLIERWVEKKNKRRPIRRCTRNAITKCIKYKSNARKCKMHRRTQSQFTSTANQIVIHRRANIIQSSKSNCGERNVFFLFSSFRAESLSRMKWFAYINLTTSVVCASIQVQSVCDT